MENTTDQQIFTMEDLVQLLEWYDIEQHKLATHLTPTNGYANNIIQMFLKQRNDGN